MIPESSRLAMGRIAGLGDKGRDAQHASSEHGTDVESVAAVTSHPSEDEALSQRVESMSVREQDVQSDLFTENASEYTVERREREHDERTEPLTTGGSEHGDSGRGRVTNHALPRLPGRDGRRPLPSIASNWGAGSVRSDSIASRGTKRQNEDDPGRESKAVKLIDGFSRGTARFWKPVAIQAQQRGDANRVTGVNVVGHVGAAPNFIGQAVGGASDAITAVTTKDTLDGYKCVVSGYNEAARRSTAGKVLSTFTPIHRAPAAGKVGQIGDTSQSRQKVMPWQTQGSKGRPQNQRDASSSSALVPYTANRHPFAPVRTTEAAGGGEPVAEETPVDLTGEDDGMTCDICHTSGTHQTGRCAMVTSLQYGDTSTDPYCNHAAGCTKDSNGYTVHTLQGQQRRGSNVFIACPRLNRHWDRGDIWAVWHALVLERRRQPPLAVFTEEFCFVGLTIAYADAMHNGNLPPEMDGIWPYTKADAVKHEKKCAEFWKAGVGLENMPPGELESLTFAEIRKAYSEHKLLPQIRWTNQVRQKRASMQPLRLGHDNVSGTAARQSSVVDDSGDTVMPDRESRQARMTERLERDQRDDLESSRRRLANAEGPGGRIDLRPNLEKGKEKQAATGGEAARPLGLEMAKRRMRMPGAASTSPAQPPAGAPEDITMKGALSLDDMLATIDQHKDDEEDYFGVITGSGDVPTGLWTVWGLRHAQDLKHDGDLAELFRLVHRAGQKDVQQLTQGELFCRLAKRYKEANLDKHVAEAFERCLYDWKYLPGLS